jgi:hypothetical protein
MAVDILGITLCDSLSTRLSPGLPTQYITVMVHAGLGNTALAFFSSLDFLAILALVKGSQLSFLRPASPDCRAGTKGVWLAEN